MSPRFEYREDGGREVIFDFCFDEFVTRCRAELWLESRGFSVGDLDGQNPRGVVLGADIPVPRWSVMAEPLRDIVLDGVLTGLDPRGPQQITIFGRSSFAAREAVVRADPPPVTKALPPPAPSRVGSFIDRIGHMAPVAAGFLCLAASVWLITHPAILLPGSPIAKSTLRLEPYASGRLEARR